MKKEVEKTIVCRQCKRAYRLRVQEGKLPRYCIYCGAPLQASPTKSLESDTETFSAPSISHLEGLSLIAGDPPQAETIQFGIGPYQVLSEIGKGGMGEVFLAFDTICGRKIALKRIRSDLMEHVQMHNRFLKEARITSQLTHPSIIPIYAIETQNHQSYYTMPYVQGETLKQILRRARLLEKQGEKPDAVGGSISALVRIFLNICQAIAYAHSKWVLHRDVKPENIIVGQYGEVLILDWGLAKLIHPSLVNPAETTKEGSAPEIAAHPLHHLTLVGKVVGTVAYMAPERARGNPATFQTDIYSLGAILYQILTLRHPFKRPSLQHYRETMHLEKIRDPIEVAPYREVPRVLARIAMKCLDPDVEKRYRTVDALIHDLKNYIEGRTEWFQTALLDLNNREDWEFQENVLIAEHMAITRSTEISDWVSLMISKSSFSPNLKIEAKVRLGSKSHGLGFLLSIPEAVNRHHLNDGYCLWMGTAENRATKLLSATVEVMQMPDAFLTPGTWHQVDIEKVENHLHIYLDHQLQFSYISYFPLLGTHVGLLARDADFEIEHFTVSVGSQNVMVNCLAVPDAFLAQKDYATALSEYRRIGYSFPGRTEGREALFRAGITLLEQAKNSRDLKIAEELYELALAEFEKLRHTPGAPLEYLGKALVYQSLNDPEEEIKCFELAFRRYRRHPLLKVLEEQQVFRMYSSSHSDRQAAYGFILLALRHLPEVSMGINAQKLFTSLKKHWEPLFFIEEEREATPKQVNHSLAISLAFWLAKPYVLLEIFDELVKESSAHERALSNILRALIELGACKAAEEKWNALTDQQRSSRLELIGAALLCEKGEEEQAFMHLLQQAQFGHVDTSYVRTLSIVMQRLILIEKSEKIEPLYAALAPFDESRAADKILIDSFRIWAALLEKKWEFAGQLLHHYSMEMVSQESSPLFFLYGCWLLATESREIASIHLSAILDLPFPSFWSLASHYLHGRLAAQEWKNRAFMWEKRQLQMQLSLYYFCLGDEEEARSHFVLARQLQVD